MNTCKQCLQVTEKCMTCPNELGPVPERPISTNPGLKFCFCFCICPMYYFRITFCVIITISLSKGSTEFCRLKLHVPRKENLA